MFNRIESALLDLMSPDEIKTKLPLHYRAAISQNFKPTNKV